MKTTKIKEIVTACLNQKKSCRMFFCYDENYRYYIPLSISDKLFLGIEEDDFILDGYSIRQLKDIIKVQIRKDMCEKILNKEGILNSIMTPEVNLKNWKMVFTSLQILNKNIIVEKESLNEADWEFAIGRIEKVHKKHVDFRHFDANGKWLPKPYKIPYTAITTVTFASRYVEVFSKYLSELPEDFGK